ncbi:MAG: anaerobic ribonucleoside-triphosphate reductase activating protein [Clostridiales bacterium]|nr:anaerobic ribonucleoside-triphosphate reductase activating protein [Clostridiales bacterium]
MKIRISGVEGESIVDGKGFRSVIFVQGCTHHCPGCHNPQTHPLDGGREVEVSELLSPFLDDPLIDGITISGGEPFLQPAPCREIAALTHECGKNVWVYTGFVYEDLLRENQKDRMALLQETDILVDGRFEQGQKSYELNFRGSRNQRIIDVRKSFKIGKAVVLDLDLKK